MKDSLEVWLDAEFTSAPCQVGVLANDRGQIRFTYEPAWLGHSARFALDPDLSLDAAPFFPKPELGNFGVFLDSSPDRWGQTLMKRREALQAKDEGRRPRTLYAWDFLLGVQDITRQGALRFRGGGDEPFLADEARAAPPVTSLRELQSIALELTSKRIDDLDALRRWLAVLVAPGASLGGARPKANFIDTDGTLWIAKFPSREDDRDVGAWEGIAHSLARSVGVEVSPQRTVRLGSEHHTFCVRRFDRVDGRRRFFVSAQTLLRKEHSEGTSYLELAQFLRKSGDPNHVAEDLAQLFRRVAFNVAIGNRDDHLRNHGFILNERGYRPSPAFDLNPNVDKADHVLNIDDADNRPSLALVRSTATFYGLTDTRADAILNEVTAGVRTWRDLARRAGIGGAEMEVTASALQAVE